jgi:hypothetical protein
MLIAVGALSASALGFAASGEWQGRAPTPFEVGRPLPELTLPDFADGRPRSIAEFRGRKIILQVFASW